MRFFRAKIAFLTFCFLLAGGAAFVRAVQAQPITPVQDANKAALELNEAPIRQEVAIPGSRLETIASGVVVGRVRDLADYLGIIYNFLISIVGIVAAVMIMVGGFGYLTAGGDASRVSVARERIGNALIGLILALSSYVILNTVNPDLVNLKVPNVTPINTVSAFLPFCDELAKRSGVDYKEVVQAPTAPNKQPTGKGGCGDPGYIRVVQKDEFGNVKNDANGKPIEGRSWCIFRSSGVKKENGKGVLNGGCGAETRIEIGRVGTNPDWFFPDVCIPIYGVSSADLEQEFVEKGYVAVLNRKLGACYTCPHLTNDRLRKLGYQVGPEGCQVWANIANNGTAADNFFKLQHTKEIGWVFDSERPSQMYYCGYSASRGKCVYVNVWCHGTEGGRVDSCGDYDDESITFCKDTVTGTPTDCRNEELQSFTGGSYNDHLGPICTVNPCGVAGKCGQGTTVSILQALGRSGGTTSTVIRGATFGIIDPARCKD